MRIPPRKFRFPFARSLTLSFIFSFPSLSFQPFFARIASTLSSSLPALSAFELSGVHWVFRPNTGSASAASSGKEWVSPPVTPRPADAEVLDVQDWDFGFNEAFMEWAY